MEITVDNPIAKTSSAPGAASKDYSIGIDIGSTATKAVVMKNGQMAEAFVVPTGFSSVDASSRVAEQLAKLGYPAEECAIGATGYGRVAVPFATKTITEITCHGRGAHYIFNDDGIVVDVGGQDTKVIDLRAGRVRKFVMNDKCSAGTGKFLEIMANRMGVSQERLSQLARDGRPTTISSMCTVFAESEVISLIGKGEPLENIANGVVESVISKVCTLASQMSAQNYFLTGGLCENDYVVERLGERLGAPVRTEPSARYAGAIGAAILSAI